MAQISCQSHKHSKTIPQPPTHLLTVLLEYQFQTNPSHASQTSEVTLILYFAIYVSFSNHNLIPKGWGAAITCQKINTSSNGITIALQAFASSWALKDRTEN